MEQVIAVRNIAFFPVGALPVDHLTDPVDLLTSRWSPTVMAVLSSADCMAYSRGMGGARGLAMA